MKRRVFGVLTFFVLFGMVILPGCQTSPEANVSLEWIQQVNSSSTYDDIAHAIDGESGLYIAGQTSGTFSENNNMGGIDAFLLKYDNDNNLSWIDQLGTTGDDYLKAIVVGPDCVYVAGSTTSVFENQTGKGGIDAFLAKYDLEGNQIWVRQFGSTANDYAHGVSIIDSGVYVAGYTYGEYFGEQKLGDADAFLVKYDPEGNLIWVRQFGSSFSDFVYGTSVNESGIYLTGTTYGNLPGSTNFGVSDAFIAKYDEEGNQKWIKQLGTSASEYANSISVDNNGVYITGVTFGDFPGYSNLGGIDAFIAKLDYEGGLSWTRQFGSSETDLSWSICTHLDYVYITGYTYGVFPAQNNNGQYDVFVNVYDLQGNEIRTYQFGTTSDDYAKGIFVNSDGLFVTGSTLGTFQDQVNTSGYDGYIAKLKN
jgi:hypothetical protein